MAVTKATGVHKIHSTFSTSGGVLSFYRDNASTQLAVGEDGTGLDFKLFGDTTSAWVLWDESADTLLFASSAKLAVGGTFTVSGGSTFSGAVDITSSVNITGAVTTSGDVTFTGSTNINDLLTVGAAATFTGNIIASGADIAINSASVKIGNASTDKIGFFGQTAAAQPVFTATSAAASTIAINVLECLRTLGLMSATG